MRINFLYKQNNMSEVEIAVNLPNPHNKIVKIKMKSSDTIYSLKSEISYITSIHRGDIHLEHNFEILYDDYIISDCNIVGDTFVDLKIITSYIDIFYMDHFGKTHPIKVRENSSIYEVKKAIENRDHYKPETQRLIHSGQQLKDDKTITDYGIVENTRIHLLVKNIES